MKNKELENLKRMQKQLLLVIIILLVFSIGLVSIYLAVIDTMLVMVLAVNQIKVQNIEQFDKLMEKLGGKNGRRR